MDSDESAHSESEFYYPEEQTLNQMTPINLFPNFKKKKSKKTSCTVFPLRTSLPVNNIYITHTHTKKNVLSLETK